MNRKLKGNIALVVVLALILPMVFPAVAVASNTTDVTVNATPAFISISVAPGTYAFGVIATSSVTSSANTTFTVTNGSTVSTNVTIAVVNATWIGGTAWTHSETATAGADTVGLNSTKANGDWGVDEVIVKNATPDQIATSQAATVNFKFGLRMFAPTSFSDGVTKSNVVRLTAAMDG